MNIKLKNKKYLVGAVIISLGVSLLLYRFCFLHGYFFLSNGIMSDLVRANLPTYYLFYDKLTSGEMSLWSWKMGIGTDVFSHADIVGDPFTYLLFIRGREHIPDMFVWNQIARNIAATITMYYYLSEFKIEKLVCLFGSVMYAFSGIQIFGNNFALGTICIYAPIVFLGIEKFLKENKIGVLIIALALTAIYSYYFYIGLGLVSAAYMVVRYTMLYDHNIKAIINRLFKLLGMGGLGIGISFFLFFPQILLTLKNARISSGKDTVVTLELFLPHWDNLFTAFTRIFDLNIFGNMVTQNYTGAVDYATFTTYATPVAIPLIVQYYAYSNKEERKSILLILFLCAASVLFPFFSYITNMFSTVNYRWDYTLNILIVLGTCLGAHKIIENKEFKKNWLYVSLALLTIVLTVSFFSVRQNYSELTYVEKRSVCNIVVIFGLLVLFSIFQNSLLHYTQSYKIMILIIGISFLWSAKRNYNYWFCDEFTLHGFTDTTKLYDGTDAELIHELQKNDDSFFRVDKNFDAVVDSNNIDSENDSMAQEYNGLKCYNSQNNPEYISFLQNMGIPCTISFVGEDALHKMDAQEMVITYVGNDHYVIKCPYTNLALEENEENLIWKGYADQLSQQWLLETDNDGNVYIKSALNGRMLTVQEEAWNVELQEAEASENQKFILTSLGEYTDFNAASNKSKVPYSGLFKISCAKNQDFNLTSDMSAGVVRMTSDCYAVQDYSGANLNYISGAYDHYNLISYLGTKYYLTDSLQQNLPDYFRLINEKNGYYVYMNTAYYPLAFTTEYAMSLEQFKKLGTAAKEQRILNTAVIDGAVNSEKWEATEICEAATKKQNSFKLEKFEDDNVRFDLKIDDDARYIVISVPYDKKWKVKINGADVQTERVNGGLIGVPCSETIKGEKVEVELQYDVRYLYIGAMVSALSFGLALFVLYRKSKNA